MMMDTQQRVKYDDGSSLEKEAEEEPENSDTRTVSIGHRPIVYSRKPHSRGRRSHTQEREKMSTKGELY
jgi:hypothetical protein